MNTPYQITGDPSGNQTVTVVIDSKIHVSHTSEPAGRRVLELLGDLTLSDAEREEAILHAMAPLTGIAANVDDSRVTVEDRRVLFDGENLPTALTRKIVAVVRDGLPLAPWKRFVVRLFENPSRGAQAELNEFLETASLPITEDGCFLAYKRVTEDYRDLRTQTFDNSVGSVVEMPREDVDPDRDRTCSRGLHFCSQDYLAHFYSGGGRIVIVKVNPTDVVSIPSDYQFTKGRTWRYEVVGEVPLETETDKEAWGVYDNTFTSFPDGVEDDPLDWDADEDDSVTDRCGYCDVLFDIDDLDDYGYCVDCGDEVEADEEAETADAFDEYGEPYDSADSAGFTVADYQAGASTTAPPPFVGEAPVQNLTRLQKLRLKFGRS